jgi:hypothetical protein
MCVYCKEAAACEHERDACAASRGERCIECGHGSAAFLSSTPGPRRPISWFPKVHPRRRKQLEKTAQASRVKAKSKTQ